MWLSADWFVKEAGSPSYLTGDRFFTFFSPSISASIRAIETDLGTAYCQAYCRSCKIVFFWSSVSSHISPPKQLFENACH